MAASPVIGSFVAAGYAVFALMLLVSAAIGVYYAIVGRGQSSSREFLMGVQSMTAIPVALSLTASFMSTITVLATPAEVYRYGASYGLFSLSYVLVVVVSSEVFLPVFYRLGITSTYEYLEIRFNRATRLLGTVMLIVQTVSSLSQHSPTPYYENNPCATVTGMGLWGAVISTGVVCTFYCTMGGLKAVVWTDVFQVGIMLAGFLSVIIRAVDLQGGVSNILNHAEFGGRLNFWDFDASPHTHVRETPVLDLSFLYGALCIGMAGIASLMGSLLQAAISMFGIIGGPLLGLFSLGILCPYANAAGGLAGLLSGLVMSLWVEIGAQFYPPLPEQSRPLGLTSHGCNFTTAANAFNWTASPTEPSLQYYSKIQQRDPSWLITGTPCPISTSVLLGHLQH
ncbi:sodium-coupled monocarboxylate transporter 1-like [Salmo trutta]|uniref:sodium-coupled monocarboxylate transporter 1-like n=1 Tax=Salmo trutta TaxID=8032 RepID=UPI0011325EA9|nr:sodium-coupled monocarboxylate transporter 1-like [Salmo trutta]